ncbi:hypothetical protein NBH00_09740 [Paraconexibacter antarcticus]|uniref:Uncharacterized protein n=1 Tax=Paraconexibacter antarcticus TaxID=2949664 RepID=A0ABY5E0X9_9ACTN|nr:hypothetical protein [Paraconexibacter antarcticus]UTI66474.1 hypothetical protein NBH00_09740 [Paraconexibacter antarcticus]
MRSLAVVPAVLLALAAPAAAGAATGPWSAPQDLSGPHSFVDAPQLLAAPDGRTLATWRPTDGGGAAGLTGTAGAFRRPTAPGFGVERIISRPRDLAGRPSTLTAPVAYARSRTLVAVTRPETARGDRLRLSVAAGDTAGRFGATRTVAVQTHLRGPQLAAGAAGDAALAWWQDGLGATDRVWVSLRRPGGRFGAPRLLETGRVRSVSVAVSPRGDVLVAWDAQGSIRTRLRPAGARTHFHRTDTLRSRPPLDAIIRTAMTPRGRAYVAWTAQLVTEGGGIGAFTAEVAVRPVGAARFRPAQLLEEEHADVLLRAAPDLVTTGEGATFAWSGRYAGHQRVRVASTDAAAVFRGVTDVSPADGTDAVDPTLAAGADGRRVLAWTQQSGDSGGLNLAAYAPGPGAAFGPPEVVSAGPESRVPDAAVTRDGVPIVVWSARPAGSAVPFAQLRTFAQAASRMP